MATWSNERESMNREVVRRIDSAGRLVVPVDMREALNIGPDEELSISVIGEEIVIKKNEPNCVFCGSSEGLVCRLRGKPICRNCFLTIARYGEDLFKG